MPQVTGFTPAWLSRPNPGHDCFTPSPTDANYPKLSHSANGKKVAKPGPLRTIAKRGTEVFIAVGREIRWADLVYLKEAWADGEGRRKDSSRGKERKDSQYDGDHAQGYRIIKTPVADDIRQLIISPNGNYLAILTTHTVHIAVLPDPSHLTAVEKTPMRIKTFQLGPTTHVTSQSAVASALWHPLGVNGACLVTITEDSVVRVWELSPADRGSFDKSTLAIDLKKLADGTSTDQDFGASISGTNKGFSPDSFDMEVAAACFASRNSGGWSPMTLWVAMREGDVYALCPLLPSKWSPPPTLIPSLSVSIVTKNAVIEDDIDVPTRSKLLAQQQLQWMSEIDNQEPSHVESGFGDASEEVYSRPLKPGKIPKLQGPFDFDSFPSIPEDKENELDGLLTDIYVIGPKMDSEELMFGEENELEVDEIDEEGLSVGVVCLLASSGQVSVFLDLDGIEAQWLPSAKSRMLSRFVVDDDSPSLLTFDMLDTIKSRETQFEENWPLFSRDVNSRYAFYVTDISNITYMSLDWVFRLEGELNGSTQGSDFRIDLLVKSEKTLRQRIFSQKLKDKSSPLTASTLILDPDLGYFLLSATPSGPVAITFDSPTADDNASYRSSSPTYERSSDQPLIMCEPRLVYQPADAFIMSSSLPSLLEKLRSSKHKRLMKEEVRLSPATLTMMMEAHKVLSAETHRLGSAAAELFRRCEELQMEFKDQITKAEGAKARVDVITGDDVDVALQEDDGVVETAGQRVERRLEKARARQASISQRLEEMRKRVAKGSARELSEKEKAWGREVTTLEAKLEPGEKTVGHRYEEVEKLKEKLLDDVAGLLEGEHAKKGGEAVLVSSEARKKKVGEVFKALERETALVEGAKMRLERLSLA